MNTEVEQHQASQAALLKFTPTAIAYIKASIAKHGSCQAIRVAITTTGCSGLAYQLDYIDAPAASDILLDIGETFQVYIDPKALPYIKGSTVDYVTEGIQKKLIFDNPNQTGSCGCGESFTVE